MSGTFKSIIHSHIDWGTAPTKEEWVTYRKELFETYFLEALKCQTEKNFEVILHIHKNFTYCIEQFKELEARSDFTIHIVGNEDKHPLATDKILEDCKKYDWVYHTRCDTDDFFSKVAMERIQNCTPEVQKAFIFQTGFNYNMDCKRIGIYGARFQSNSTIVFPTDYFLDPVKSVEYGICRHLRVKQQFHHEMMGNHQYCILTHKHNDSTGWSGSRSIKPLHWNIFLENFPIMQQYHEDMMK